MFLRHFRRFETCSYHLTESATTYSESQYCLGVGGQGVVWRDNEHHPSNLRMRRKQNCLYISLMFPKLFVQLYNN